MADKAPLNAVEESQDVNQVPAPAAKHRVKTLRRDPSSVHNRERVYNHRRMTAQVARLNGKVKGSDSDDRWATYESAWDALHEEDGGEWTIFDQIEIQKDGGLEQIGHKPDLWYRTRYLSAVIMVAFIVYNVSYIIFHDLEVMLQDSAEETGYLIGPWILSKLTWWNAWDPTSIAVKCISFVELAFLAYNLSILLFYCFQFFCRHGYTKWHSLAYIFWEGLPDLSYFSAMQLLHYATSQVLAQQLQHRC